jgi:hypothetical protein
MEAAARNGGEFGLLNQDEFSQRVSPVSGPAGWADVVLLVGCRIRPMR